MRRRRYLWRRRTRVTFWKSMRILLLLTSLTIIAIILSAVGLFISGDISLPAGVVVLLIGLPLLIWPFTLLSKRRSKLPNLFMALLICLIFIMVSSAYLDVRSFTDVKDSIIGAFTEEEFRSNVEELVDRVKLTFEDITEDIAEEIEEFVDGDTGYVYIDGAILIGADGHKITLINNSDATDPSWNELKEFLALDNTDQQVYNFAFFVCADFAEVLHNNAEAAGIRAAYVLIDLGPTSYYPSGDGHCLNAFQTIDRGLIYIDCTAPIGSFSGSADKTVNVQVGKSYIGESIFLSYGWSSRWESMGEVTEIELVQW